MLDEIERLRTNPFLLQLLGHYVRLAQPDREVWQERLMAMDGVEPTELTKLHGDLLAFGWIEWGQNGRKSSACYRMTSDGMRAYGLIAETIVTVECPPVTSANKRKKKPRLELVATDA